jgi:hypothetical protein
VFLAATINEQSRMRTSSQIPAVIRSKKRRAEMNKRSAKVVWGTLTGLAMFSLVICIASSGVFAEPGEGGQASAKVTARFNEITAL